MDYCSSPAGLKDLENRPNYTMIKGDICSTEFVQYVLREHSINVVLHLAAQTHVDNSFGDSLEFTKNNVYGTHVLLEAARHLKIMKFIHVSTDEVYGEVARHGVRTCCYNTKISANAWNGKRTIGVKSLFWRQQIRMQPQKLLPRCSLLLTKNPSTSP